MLASSAERILSQLDEDAVVLDIGGWADPFPRADYVMDLMPYETRGLYAREGWVPERGSSPERFNGERWVQRDICDHDPYPFSDGQIDFVICSQTLEDVRDPVWVCREISRIGKAGYVEVPSRLEEQCYGIAGEFVGWGHHRWLIDVVDGDLVFVFKHAARLTSPRHHFPPEFHQTSARAIASRRSGGRRGSSPASGSSTTKPSSTPISATSSARSPISATSACRRNRDNALVGCGVGCAEPVGPGRGALSLLALRSRFPACAGEVGRRNDASHV